MSAREKKIHGENEEDACGHDDQKTSRKDPEQTERVEMYNNIEVEKQVCEVIKKGENLILKGCCNAVNLPNDIIEYSKQCSKTGVAPIPKIFKIIKENCLAMTSYNLFNHA